MDLEVLGFVFFFTSAIIELFVSGKNLAFFSSFVKGILAGFNLP